MVKLYNNIAIVLIVLLIAWPKYWLFPVGPVAVSPFSLLMLLSLAMLAVLFTISPAISQHVLRQIVENRRIFGLWVVWCAWRLIADALGQTPAQSTGITLRSIIYSESILLVGILAFSTQRVRDTMPIILTGVAAVATLVGVYEYQAQRTFANIMGISFAGLNDDAASNAIRQTTEFYRDGAYRAASFFSHSIVFAQFIGAVAPVAIHLLRYGRGLPRLFGAIALVLVPVALVISGARSGFVVAATSVGLYFFLGTLGNHISTRRLLTIVATSGLAAILLLSPLQAAIESITQGGTNAEQSSSLARDEMITRGIYALQIRPISGYGNGQAAQVAGMTGRNDIRTIDNLYLSTTVDFGLLGIGLFIAFLTAIAVTHIRAINRAPDLAGTDVNRAYLAFSASIFVGQIILSIPDNLSVIFALAGLAGCLSADGCQATQRSTEETGGRKPEV